MREPMPQISATQGSNPPARPAELPPGQKMLVEAGPLLLFFIVNAKWGIFAATAVYMASAVLAMGYAWAKVRRIALMPLIALGFVLLFGGLTIWLHDDTFIKVKVTLVNALFGAILLGGLAFNRLFLRMLMGQAFAMTQTGWRRLTLAWGLFFFFLAGLNEVVWRNVSTDTWVNFKVFGLMPLTFVFAFATMPLMLKHQISAPEQENDGRH